MIISSLGTRFMSRSSTTSLLPAAPIWLSVFAFATVHESTQIVISLILSVLSIYLLRQQSKNPPRLIFYSLVTCSTITLFSIVPLPISTYSMVMGSQFKLVEPGLLESNAQWQPIAFRPRQHTTQLILLFSTLLYGWACGSLFTHVRRFKYMAHHVVYCAITLSVLAWAQKLTSAQSIYWVSNTPSYTREYFFGSFVNPNHAGAFLAAVLPLALSMRGNKKYIFTCILGLSLWSTQSRGAVLAGVLCVSLYSMYMFKSYAKYLSIGILVSLLIASLQLDFFQSEDDPFSLSRIDDWSSERLDIWGDSLHAIMRTPLLGTGSGGFVDLYDQVKSNPRFTQTHHSHQEYIELLTTYGWLVGGILILLWLYTLLRGIQSIQALNDVRKIRWRVAALCGFVSYSLCSLIDFPLQIGANLILFVCYASILLSFQGPKTQPNRIMWPIFGIILILTSIVIIAPTAYQNTTKKLVLGEEYRQNKEYTKAQAAFIESIRSAPFASRPVRQYALTIRHSNPKHAIKLAKDATTLAPFNSLTWVTLAELYTLQEQYEESLISWKQALNLDLPNNDQGTPYITKALSIPVPLEEKLSILTTEREDRIREMAQVLYKNNHNRHAERLLHTLPQENLQTKIILAELYIKTQRPQKAWDILSQLPPKNCQLARSSAKTLVQLGKSKEAIRYYRIAMDHCGATESLTRQLLIARLLQAEERAIMEVSMLLRKKTKNIRLRKLLLHALAVQKDYSAMIPHLRKLQEMDALTDTERDDIKRIQYGLPILAYPLDIQ